jgi:hypothetical protein
MVIGLDVSGSFRNSGHFDDALEFASLYIYAHMKGYHDLRRPTDVFVGTMGGKQSGEAKTFHPIQDLSGKSPSQIAASLRAWFPETDPITDYNAFFERVSVHVQRQNLTLAPLSIVMFSDGVPDIPGAKGDDLYRRVNLTPGSPAVGEARAPQAGSSLDPGRGCHGRLAPARGRLQSSRAAGFPVVLDEECGGLPGEKGKSAIAG